MTEQELNATPIKLELPLGAVNFILAALAKAPYEQVTDLVLDRRGLDTIYRSNCCVKYTG